MSEPTVEVASIIVRVGTSALTMKPEEAKALRDELLKMYPVEQTTTLLIWCDKCQETHHRDYQCHLTVGGAARNNHQLL